MKQEIHPATQEVEVICSCGYLFMMFTVLTENQRIESCNKCCPAYTGKAQKNTTDARAAKFKKRFG
jgi:ribosomal protein L31